MRIIFSRKGFDSTAGGAPSPIVAGQPVSLPIPARDRSATTYADRGLGPLVEQTTRGRITAQDLCHDDPLFADGQCWFGQSGGAQSHLARHGVTTGDVFLFFGLFTDPANGERHHRIFATMKVACHGAPDTIRQHPEWQEPPRPHPHDIGDWGQNNAIYHGPAAVARTAAPALRLTRAGDPLRHWRVPPWLRRRGLTYHAKPERWPRPGELIAVSRGQEFICDIGRSSAPRLWLDGIVRAIRQSD